MALNSYSSLQTTIATWLGRPADTNIASNVADMITLFEAEARRRLKTRFNETETTLTTTANVATVALPSDFGEMREIKIVESDADEVLEFMPPEQLDAAVPTLTTDEPIWYTIEGTNLRFKNVPDTSYSITIVYMQTLAALSSSNTTNWLLTNHPDAYLFGSLAEAECFIGDDPRFPLWKQRRDEVFASILQSDQAARWSGGPLIMKTDTGNP